MENTIVLFRSADAWMARHLGAHRAEIVRLFGTDTIPTAFTAQADETAVWTAVRRFNPDVSVIIDHAAAPTPARPHRGPRWPEPRYYRAPLAPAQRSFKWS